MEVTKIPKLLKMRQVAEILAISKTQAYRLTSTGELPSVRFGKCCIRVKESDLVAFIENSRKNGGEL